MKPFHRRIFPILAAAGLALHSHGVAQETVDMTAGPAPKAKPWESGWGYWPNVPKAWQQTHQGLLSRAQKGNVNVYFLGDSITAGWAKEGREVWAANFEKLGAANFGIGGDTTRQVLWRIEHGEMDGVNPKLVVLMIGVNNIFTNNGTNEEIVKGVEEVIKQIQVKAPAAKVLLLSILPLKLEPFDKRVREVNPLLAKLAGGQVTFSDLTDKFRGPDGKSLADLYVADGTHLAAKGYETWAAAMKPEIEKLLK